MNFRVSSKVNACPVCDRRHQSLEGKVFERLTVSQCSGKTRKRNTIWKCQCVCRNQIEVETDALKSGNTRSCGCLQKELLASKKHRLKHGKHGTKVYRAWCGIKDRCLNPDCLAYKDYGARGITLCSEWHDFEAFYADMGDPPTSDHTIERLDNNQEYSVSNCTWATQKQQNRNRRNTVLLTIGSDSKPFGEWAEAYGIPRKLLYDRVIKLGWAPMKALTTTKKG